MVYPKYVGGKANSVDPDQTASWSSLVCTFCSGLSVIHYTISGDHTVNLPFRKKKKKKKEKEKEKKNAVPSGQKLFWIGRILVGRQKIANKQNFIFGLITLFLASYIHENVKLEQIYRQC